MKENITPGSNLWWESSRMMIPQHKEALNERQDLKPGIITVQIPSREELELIRDHIMLLYMLTIVERNGRLQLSMNSLQKPYLGVTDILSELMCGVMDAAD
jgi:hypothetical protein